MQSLTTSVLLLSLGLMACGDKEPSPKKQPDTGVDIPDGDTAGPDDADGDGWDSTQDCDDDDPDVFPGAIEECNQIDDDCTGVIDDDFLDTDGDGTPDCLDAEECDADASVASVRARMAASPASGRSARMSTATGSFTVPATTLTQQCMP